MLVEDKVTMTNKGFTLLSMILTLMIISSCLLLTLKNKNEVSVSHITFMNEYLDLQSDSLLYCSDNYIDEYGIHFNNKGHINKARTIEIGNHKIILHLGNGYASVE